MSWIAWKMLTGDRAKYLGIVFGVAFASLLMSHQISIFAGIMRRTASQITDVRDADIWVMNPATRSIDETPALSDMDLHRIRGVPGVAWAVPFYKGQVHARLTTGDFRNLVLLGVDDASLVGAPRELVLGSLEDLRQPDAVIIDQAGYTYVWPGQPLKLGRVLELNDHRAVLVGICKASAPFQTLPVLYARHSQALHYAPPERRLLPFVLAKPQAGYTAAAVCQRIQQETGLLALTQEQFVWKTINYYLSSTGIPVNFGITIALGFFVGVAIAGQTFYLFTIENLKQFGSLKAMGMSNLRLVKMILLQALVVGILGYGIGVGLAAAFFQSTQHIVHLQGFFLPWQVLVGTGAAVLVIVFLASLLSIRRVLVLEPAIVFR